MRYAEKHISITPIKREMPPKAHVAAGGMGYI